MYSSYCRLCRNQICYADLLNIFDDTLKVKIYYSTDTFKSHFKRFALPLNMPSTQQFLDTNILPQEKMCASPIPFIPTGIDRKDCERSFGNNMSLNGNRNEETIFNDETDFTPSTNKAHFIITADNCDNIIIPDGINENAIQMFQNNDTASSNVNCNTKKIPLSKIVTFLRSKIQIKTNAISNTNKNGSYEVSNQRTESSAPEHKLEFDDCEIVKLQKKRQPPKLNPDDIKCPFCGWFIPKEEFEPYHLNCHLGDAEFHKFVTDLWKGPKAETQEIDLRCPHCDLVLKNVLLLEEHKNYHLGRKVIKCHLCDRSAISRKRLRHHMCTAHLVRSHRCDVCNYMAKDKAELNRHKIGRHSDERIMCPVCGKLIHAFQQNMRKHLETHNEKLAFKCNMCPKGYKTRDSLQRHNLTAHFPETVMCSSCGMQCHSKPSYKRHISRCKLRNQLSNCS